MPLTTPRAAFRNLKGKTASSSSLKCAESKDPARRIVRTQQAAPKLHNKAALPLPRGQTAATAKWQFSECLYGGAYGAVSFGAKEVVTEEIHKGTLRPRLSTHTRHPSAPLTHLSPPPPLYTPRPHPPPAGVRVWRRQALQGSRHSRRGTRRSSFRRTWRAGPRSSSDTPCCTAREPRASRRLPSLSTVASSASSRFSRSSHPLRTWALPPTGTQTPSAGRARRAWRPSPAAARVWATWPA